MAKIIDAKIRLKRSSNEAEEPTVAPSNDHLDGTWDAFDIYVGEPYVNVNDDRFWIRTDNGIMELPFIKTNQANGYNRATASGTDTYTATLTPTLTEYTSGNTFIITFTNANTGAATINVDSLGAKALQKNGSALASGDLGAGKTYMIYYNGTAFQVLGLAGSGGGITNSAANNYVTKSDGTNVVQSQIYDNGTFLGIGTTSQSADNEYIRVHGSDTPICLSNGTTRLTALIDSGGGTGAYIGTTTNHALTLYANNGAGALVINSSEQVEINNMLYITTGASLVFEGSTADAYETTLTVADPTADRTITLPNATGTVVLADTTDTLTNKTITATSNVLGGVTMTLGSDATGDVYYRNSSGYLTRLAIGTAGQHIEASSGLPAYADTLRESITVASTGNHNPADATPYYIGADGSANAGGTSQARNVYVNYGGTKVRVNVTIKNAGTAGSNEQGALYLRVNDTTDYTISAAVVSNGTIQNYSATITVTLAAGDYIEIKYLTPTWATNPTNLRYWGTINVYN